MIGTLKLPNHNNTYSHWDPITFGVDVTLLTSLKSVILLDTGGVVQSGRC